MEAFIDIITTLETVITDDLNNLSTSSNDRQTHETVDRIRINLSSHLAEARTLVIDKARTREITFNDNNQMHTVNGHVLTFIHGVVKNHQTLRSTGAYAIIWNVKHKLNICHENILTNKTPHSSHLLALLALATQMSDLKLKTVHVISTSRIVKHTVEQLPLWHAQRFLTHDNWPMTNHTLLGMIHKVIDENNLQFVTYNEPVQEPILQLSQGFSDAAKKLIRDKMRAT